ncbi:hypothetical protein [Ensifer sp.]|uniref:hypothetical protein n=1 Tax=Ensifer sp. TaxID=1872086 RepID=UPI00289D974A|nr:hypothetical protein [Ensifer sp.]
MRMKNFLELTFGPSDIRTVETVLDEWRERRLLPRDHPDSALAAAILFSLFRAGHDTVPKLQAAASRHKGLAELTPDDERPL